MNQIKSRLTKTISSALLDLSFPEQDYSLIPPKNLEFGDLSLNLPLLLARSLKRAPMDIANEIAKKISVIAPKDISDVTVTAPGFINFKISDSYFQSRVKNILEMADAYGQNKRGRGKTANVEFVSANPTGPLTVGHGRNAVLGDAVSNILEWQGFEVTREYYFNDAGRQMRILGESVKARYYEILGEKYEFPEDGYQGDYIKDIAQGIIDEIGNNKVPNETIFKKFAEDSIFEDIKKSLLKLGIHFQKFTNEKTFYENGDIKKILEQLRKKDLLYEKEDATWFRTTALGKDQDRVYIKSTGEPTYRVPDTAYHCDKVMRGYDLIIDVFGADHADTYPDVLLALESLGLKTDHIKILLYQFVTLLRGGEKIKMSTRKANFVTMDELLDEVGADVVRYFFIMRSMNTHLDFDLDLATDQSDNNPVFYLQYAHARICNIIKRGTDTEIIFNNKYNTEKLSHPEELNLLKYMIRFPEFMDIAFETLEPQIIANYLQELSSRFHKFYSSCRVLTEDEDLSGARMALIRAARTVLGNGLKVLGISAPEKM